MITAGTSARILAALSEGPRAGLELMDSTGRSSGTLYRCLVRLQRAGYVESRWETAAEGRPARRYHHLTAAGTAAHGHDGN
ncbi:PadR family transcriptional regulator [Actinoplanes couchii]|uniref:Transcription regulator PadR N-terminal domain-containing protein n=1 Tax=Actinoplanes couchii TaxID=403638 RepID=A0ABQ3X7V5_9ACTN|nr:PadR family transcriptional regulator [Actinoplanes couchii]MDR6320431.1 DNA-binding PadR family transcriptional regulator [Actinoplanes couchii]GID54557.1 hypothetical protein Aco03nite_029610 [Actinoplanes couchii]